MGYPCISQGSPWDIPRDIPGIEYLSRGYPMAIPDVRRQYLDLGYPMPKPFCELDILHLPFMISRQMSWFVLGISPHNSEYPWDILSYFGTTIAIPWMHYLISQDSFLASLGRCRLWSIAPPFGCMTIPSPLLHHSHLAYLSLRH